MRKPTISRKAASAGPSKGAIAPDAYGMTLDDYARLRAKTDADIAADCRADPDARPPGTRRVPMHRIARVKLIRESLSMTQPEFAKAFRIPVGTLRDWEQHRAEPDRAARAYLAIIAAEPDTVRKVLSKEPA